MNTALAPQPSRRAEDIYLVGGGAPHQIRASEPDQLVQRIGFKAFGLMRMAEIGLTVPPAFVLGTRYCRDAALREAVKQRQAWEVGLRHVERSMGQRFGDPRAPLLLSVRSGAPVSMPGMMETLLDIGLCDATVQGFLRQTGDPRLVWDTYRRLVASYGELVAGLAPQVFEAEYAAVAGAGEPRTPLDFAQLRELTRRSLVAYEREAGSPFPQNPEVQLAGAIEAVLDSWNAEKACAYRKRYGVPDTIGTAVTVQAMVFGNGGGRSGAGVGFTRDPVTGESSLWIDFLFNAQGEDVVSGRRQAYGHDELSRVMPAVWRELRDAAVQLERAFGDMQDFEFTVQDGRLYLLQTRSGKRTPEAAVRIALDLYREGVIDASVARERTAAIDPATLVHTRVVSRDGEQLTSLARGVSASSGVAIGEIAFDEATARARQSAGATVILVRRDADTADLVALEAAVGLLTQYGARTSHAAVVARQLGKVCVTGCDALHLDDVGRIVHFGDTALSEGQVLTLDGNDGTIYAGEARAITAPLSELQAELASLRAIGSSKS